MSVFKGAKNVVVNGGSFVANAGSPPKSGLDILIAEVAPNAILNAGGRADEVRCFPGTRKEVIGRLEEFMNDNNPGRKRMMWLSGPAGAGKSAICQTVAERRSEQGRHVVNFFFFRGDSTRSHRKPLVATLVYQLRRFYPALDETLSNYLESDPLICSAAIDAQFKQLISSPIRTIQQSTQVQQQIAIVIDGLDECKDKRDQDQILVSLHALAYADHSPFLILVSSRAEPHLVMAFNRLGSSVKSIFLDNKYMPQKDIRLFVIAKFDEIKKDHHLAQTLSKEWPLDADIDAITNKSSGQFIYAVTVMRYIQFSSSSPALSLVTVLEMPPCTNHNPLAQVDAVYSYIFSKVDNIRAVKLILFGRNCSRNWEGFISNDFGDLLRLVGYKDIEVQSFFADLAAIIKVVPGAQAGLLLFYHASLEDYLYDKTRSTIYYVNDNGIAAEFSLMCLRNIYDTRSLHHTIKPLRFVQNPTPELSECLLDASKMDLSGKTQVLFLEDLINQIERLYWERNNAQFKALLQGWSRFVHVNNLGRPHHADVRPQNPSASQYYKQYWMAEGYSQRKPQTNSSPAGVARSSAKIAPARVTPNAAIDSPVRGLSARQPGASPQKLTAAPSKGRGGNSAPARVARINTPITASRTSPNTAVGGPTRNLSVRKPGASPQNVPTAPTKGRARSNTPTTSARASSNAAIGGRLSVCKPGASLQNTRTTSPKGRGDGSLMSQPQVGGINHAIGTHKTGEEAHGSEHSEGPCELSTIWVKIHYQDDTRAMTLTPDMPFSEFVNKVIVKFGKNFNDLTMKFKDKDGDKITLRDDSDYELAIKTARITSKGKAEGALEIWCQDSAQ